VVVKVQSYEGERGRSPCEIGKKTEERPCYEYTVTSQKHHAPGNLRKKTRLRSVTRSVFILEIETRDGVGEKNLKKCKGKKKIHGNLVFLEGAFREREFFCADVRDRISKKKEKTHEVQNWEGEKGEERKMHEEKKRTRETEKNWKKKS